MKSFDELFGESDKSGVDNVINANAERITKDGEIVRLKLDDRLHSFRGHPFKVQHNKKMEELVESVKLHGVLVPGIARIDAAGYEIVAGHCRREASIIADLPDMPFILKNLTDDEATVIMVDSNIQREDISIREKAFAYRMKYEALKRINAEKRKEGKFSESAMTGRSDTQMTEQTGDSRNTIQRYIRLTYLTEGLMDMVDDKKIVFNAGYELSFLNEAEQVLLEKYIDEINVAPSVAQAEQLHGYSKQEELNKTVLELVMHKESAAAKVVLKDKILKEYFPESYDSQKMQEVILELLCEWRKSNKRINESTGVPGQVEIEQLENGKYMPGEN